MAAQIVHHYQMLLLLAKMVDLVVVVQTERMLEMGMFHQYLLRKEIMEVVAADRLVLAVLVVEEQVQWDQMELGVLAVLVEMEHHQHYLVHL